MKIFVKTLNGTFEIQVNPEDTVDDVKKKIENDQGSDIYPMARQVLIFQGKILIDGTTVDENKVKNNDFIVLMLSTVQKNKSSLEDVSTSTTATTSKEPHTGVQPSSNATQASFPPSEAYISQIASDLIAGNNWDEIVEQMIDMGRGTWDRDTVTSALHVSRNNPLIAVAFFFSGVVSERVETPPAQSNPAPVSSSGPNTTPLDLFPQDTEDTVVFTLNELRSNPEFRVIRAMIQTYPYMLLLMLRRAEEKSPDLSKLIQDHPVQFLRLMNETYVQGGYSGPSDQVDAALQSNAVAPEDHDAIERLVAVGSHDRELIVHAYLACDKDEELTADFLLNHPLPRREKKRG